MGTKKILILFLLFFPMLGIMAQSEEAEGMMTADEFVEEEIRGVEWQTGKFLQMGELIQNSPETVSFIFKNMDEEPIVITQVKSSCSCSVSEYTKTPISQGEEGVIKVTYDAKQEGSFFKTFMLLTNKSTTPNVLVIQGEVVAK